MQIPLVDLSRQGNYTAPLILRALKKVIDASDFILGKEVERFEKEFAAYLGARHCVGVASGTDGILLALRALNIEKGDEVIVPAYSFIATVSPIIALGARPVLVDIESDYPCIDPIAVGRAITKKTKGIIPVHLYGYPCDMDALSRFAKKHGLWIVEDACQAHGGEYKGKKLGTLGTLGVFSFYPGKNLGAWGDAGVVVTNQKTLDATLRLLRHHGQRVKYKHEILGLNSRLDTMQAAVLSVKLGYLSQWNKKRQELVHLYQRLLAGLPVQTPPKAKNGTSSNHLFVLRTKQRDRLFAYLTKRGIRCGIHYPDPLHLLKPLAFLGYKRGQFPNAEKHARECLSLPLFPELTEKEVRYIVTQIRTFAEQSL